MIKQKLSQAYQILGHLGLDDHTYTHLSARSMHHPDSFYMYPFGLRFNEVTPETLLTLNFDGTIIHGFEKHNNKTGYILHGSIYENRPDIFAIFHLHTPAIVAVSAIQKGLMPISQWALHFYNQIAYHEYNSLSLNPSHGHDVVNDLQHHNILLMRHHGAIVCGRTIEEAMFFTYHLEKACQTQINLLSMNQPIVEIPTEICIQSVNDLLSFEPNLGQRDFEAWVRLIDK
jgi:ribulose-5-phosphate 4-epimerase/fuculose-1-phosphate aldolase